MIYSKNGEFLFEKQKFVLSHDTPISIKKESKNLKIRIHE